MPELPDLAVYVDCLHARVVGRPILGIEVRTPFVLRTVDPGVDAFVGRRVEGVCRIGKRIVLACADDHFVVVHLMIAGRLRWREPGRKSPGRIAQARALFETGTLWLTEASAKKRASLHLVRGADALAAFDRGGLEVLDPGCDAGVFAGALRRENRTLKRALTDPRLFSGIGNAYSDEILFRARLSPVTLTRTLPDSDVERLFAATRETILTWIAKLRAEVGAGFPEKVRAFRDGMAVHGRYREPCPECGQSVQRIRYASNECNYCAMCQNRGRLLADRGLSQLLRRDWPKTLEELEELRGGGTSADGEVTPA